MSQLWPDALTDTPESGTSALFAFGVSMDAKRWQVETDPVKMLTAFLSRELLDNSIHLREGVWQLIACAMSRHFWDKQATSAGLRAIVTIEDCLRSHDFSVFGLAHVGRVAVNSYEDSWQDTYGSDHGSLFGRLVWMSSLVHADGVSLLDWLQTFHLNTDNHVHDASLCDILRDHLGDPFQRLQKPAWSDSWPSATVRDLLSGIRLSASESKIDTERLLILADALEESGFPEYIDCGICLGSGVIYEYMDWQACSACYDERKYVPHAGSIRNPVLAHLRSGGIHYHGCWAVRWLGRG